MFYKYKISFININIFTDMKSSFYKYKIAFINTKNNKIVFINQKNIL